MRQRRSGTHQRLPLPIRGKFNGSGDANRGVITRKVAAKVVANCPGRAFGSAAWDIDADDNRRLCRVGNTGNVATCAVVRRGRIVLGRLVDRSRSAGAPATGVHRADSPTPEPLGASLGRRFSGRSSAGGTRAAMHVGFRGPPGTGGGLPDLPKPPPGPTVVRDRHPAVSRQAARRA